jgi:glutamine---fructose-6-phosphate transaminase (isomerizing)
VQWSVESAEKDGYAHFMLKEIHEQPRAIRDTLRGRITRAGDLNLSGEIGAPELFAPINRVRIVACGTSLHAGLIGKFMFEQLAQIPVEVDYASEFRYREPRLSPNEMVVAITQSGETADTLAAIQEARDKGAFVLSICNVVGSMAARQSDSVLYTHAGPEIAVASTKAFTTQIAALALMALHMAELRGTLGPDELRYWTEQLRRVADHMDAGLERTAAVRDIAEQLYDSSDFLFLARGVNYPIALEGALKLKEISYIHAEGYPAGEMKHGPIALIDEHMPVVALAPQDSLYKKMMANIEEVKGRRGIVVAVGSEGDSHLAQKADFVVEIPRSEPLFNPFLTVLPLQVLAYEAAVLAGKDVDKPRNLAKSVTVE